MCLWAKNNSRGRFLAIFPRETFASLQNFRSMAKPSANIITWEPFVYFMCRTLIESDDVELLYTHWFGFVFTCIGWFGSVYILFGIFRDGFVRKIFIFFGKSTWNSERI